MVADLLDEIRKELSTRPVLSKAVPEQYQLLRAFQFAAHYWKYPTPDVANAVMRVAETAAVEMVKHAIVRAKRKIPKPLA